MKKTLSIIVIIILVVRVFLFMRNLPNERKLQYVRASNAGILGYFNDGTYVGCPKCDFIEQNMEVIYEGKSIGTWDSRKNPDSFDEDQNNSDLKSDWVMVNYEWVTRPATNL